MSKRNTVSVTALSAFALATLCLFAAVISAQKGPQGTASSVKPVRGIDVIVKKNPGNSAARTATTNDKGEVTFVGLAPGNYSLTIVDPSGQRKLKLTTEAITYDRVEITGAVGGPITREWNVTEGKFAALSNATAKAMSAPHYEERINFEIGGNPTPVLRIIVKSHSAMY